MTPLAIDRTTLTPPPLRRRRRRGRAATAARALGLAAAAALAATLAIRLVSRLRGRRGGAPRLEWDGPAGDPRSVAGGVPDDARLLARVESEVFRDPAIPKGDIALDAVGGVVTVRGTVAPDLVDELPTLVAAVEGVVRVENLLRPAAGADG
jgi:osmotically-inducible protein OsmY